MIQFRFPLLAAVGLCLAGSVQADAAADAKRWSNMAPAVQASNAGTAALLASARAGKRVVAVGDHGVVLLSDDGRQFRQAKVVPVRSLLTSVQFVDVQHGFASGHDGVVLGTRDGGETWTLLRSAPGEAQPILALHFDSPEHGIGVGMHGWAIETHDGGRSWSELAIATGENADRHLWHVFASSGHGLLFITGESGTVFRSADNGKSWQAASTGNRGSLWYGTALADGTLLVCGMRGHLYRSGDDGKTWQAVDSSTTQSLTGIAELADGSVVVVGMGGTVLVSKDGGMSFAAGSRAASADLTAVLANGSEPLLLSTLGPLTRAGPAKP